MKTSALLTAIMIIAGPAGATEPLDTLAVIKTPGVVVMTETAQGKRLAVKGCEDDPGYEFIFESSADEHSKTPKLLSQKNENVIWLGVNKKPKSLCRKKFSTGGLRDFYAGGVIPLDGQAGMSRTGWQIGMLNVAQARWSLAEGTALSLGIGWQYSYWNIGDNLMGSLSPEGAYLLEPIPAEYSKVKTSLRNFAMQFPLLLSQRFAGRFAFEAGAVAMLNTYTTGNRSWTEDGTKMKLPLKNLHQRILTVDVIGRIGWQSRFAVYVRYSPINLFEPAYGPQFKAIAVGASLGF